MAIQTRGFGVSALPQAPNLPGNVGKLDVKAIYEAARDALDFSRSMELEPENREAKRSGLLADVAASERQQALMSPDVVGREVAARKSGLGAETKKGILSEQSSDYLLGRTPAERLAGPSTSLSTTNKFDPATGKALTSTEKKSGFAGDEVVVGTETTSSDAPQTRDLGNGQTLVRGPDGKYVIKSAPAAALTTPQEFETEFFSQDYDPFTGEASNVYHVYGISGAGRKLLKTEKVSARGPQPAGVKNADKIPAAPSEPFVRRSDAAAQAGIGRDAARIDAEQQAQQENARAKQALEEGVKSEEAIQSADKALVQLSDVEQAMEEFVASKGGTGRIAGKAREFFGEDKAQGFAASLDRALDLAIQPFVKRGSLSDKDLEAAKGRLPKIDQDAAVMRNSLKYLRAQIEWAKAREEAFMKHIRAGENADTARYMARGEVRVLNFTQVSAPAPAATPAPAAAAGPTTQEPAAQGQFQVGKAYQDPTTKQWKIFRGEGQWDDPR